MTGSASQAMDVVFRLLLGEKIIGRGSRGREGLGIRPRAEAGGLREAIETLVSSWTLVISDRQGTPEVLIRWERIYYRPEEGSGEGGRRSGFLPNFPGTDFRPSANLS